MSQSGILLFGYALLAVILCVYGLIQERRFVYLKPRYRVLGFCLIGLLGCMAAILVFHV